MDANKLLALILSSKQEERVKAYKYIKLLKSNKDELEKFKKNVEKNINENKNKN